MTETLNEATAETERTPCEPVCDARRCEFCRAALIGRRRHARFCCDRCRTAAARELHQRRIATLLDALAQTVDALRRELRFDDASQGNGR